MNNVKTAALLAGMAGLVMAIGSFWGQSGLIMAFGFSVVMIGGSYWFSDRLAIASARAKPVGPDELPEFHRVMAELTAAANLPMPGLFVSPDPQPNVCHRSEPTPCRGVRHSGPAAGADLGRDPRGAGSRTFSRS